jgi:hypothetical protein
MAPSDPLWHVRNALGLRTVCYVTPMPNGRYLLTVQRDGAILVSEHHDVPRTAIDRAGAIYKQLVEQGWTAISA